MRRFDLRYAPSPVRSLVAFLEDEGFAVTSSRGSGVMNGVVKFANDTLAVRLTADTGHWWIDLGARRGSSLFDPDLWSACLDGAPIKSDPSSFVEQAAFVRGRWREVAPLVRDTEIRACLERASDTRARRRMFEPARRLPAEPPWHDLLGIRLRRLASTLSDEAPGLVLSVNHSGPWLERWFTWGSTPEWYDVDVVLDDVLIIDRYDTAAGPRIVRPLTPGTHSIELRSRRFSAVDGEDRAVLGRCSITIPARGCAVLVAVPERYRGWRLLPLPRLRQIRISKEKIHVGGGDSRWAR